MDFAEPAVINRLTVHRGTNVPVDFVIEVLTHESGQWREIVHSRDRLPRTDDNRNPYAIELASLTSDRISRVIELDAKLRRDQAKLAQLSAGPQVYAASFNPEPAPTYVMRRGDAMQRGYEVAPSIPEFLGKMHLRPGATEMDRRVALARHLTNADHPLTARVIVNPVCQHHLGVGLVETTSDFGRMGTPPSHPELLDWLANQFVTDGWSLKKLHRQIVISDTYGQASSPRTEALAIDADSRLLWRFPPRRLEAEASRDCILRVSGKLNLTAGGPGFDFFNQRGGLLDYKPKETFDTAGWRRIVYAHKVRMISIDVFGAFDCPDAGEMKPSRTRSITSVQALGLFNSPSILRQAKFFAERLRAEAGDDAEEQIVLAFDLAFARPPTPDELRSVTLLATDHGLQQVCRAIFNTSEFAYIQ
ncbi:MAG: DUF1553 domain-containing protein [Pseudomonadota bacterium]